MYTYARTRTHVRESRPREQRHRSKGTEERETGGGLKRPTHLRQKAAAAGSSSLLARAYLPQRPVWHTRLRHVSLRQGCVRDGTSSLAYTTAY